MSESAEAGPSRIPLDSPSPHPSQPIYAPEHTLPSTRFYAIEFPGRISDSDASISRAITHLGGPSAIERVFTFRRANTAGRAHVPAKSQAADSLLELNWRPDNPFSHPIPGRTVNVNNLLLRIVKKKRVKRDGVLLENPEWEYKAEVIGIVPKTIRFRSMADFQYEPDPSDPVVQLRKAMDRMDTDAILKYTIPSPPDNITDYKTQLRTFPPPLFSRLAVPHIYNFKANPMSIKTTYIDSETGEEKERLINKSRWKGLGSAIANVADEELPSEPPKAVQAAEEKRDQRILAILREIFKERPVWLKSALLNQLTPSDARTVTNSKHLLPLVSYAFNDGPWRDTLVRFGYDPRKTVSAHIYQRIFFRNVNHVLPRASIIGRGQEPQIATSSSRISIPESAEKMPPSHLFDGKHLLKDTASFQLCDITDPMLKEIIMDRNGLRNEFDERDGWYTLPAFEQIKALLRAKFFALLEGHILTDAEARAILSGESTADYEKKRRFAPRKHNMAKGALPAEEAAALRVRAALDGTVREAAWGRHAAARQQK